MAFIQRVIEVAEERKISLDLIIPDDIPNGETVVDISFVPIVLDGSWKPKGGVWDILNDNKAFAEVSATMQTKSHDE